MAQSDKQPPPNEIVIGLVGALGVDMDNLQDLVTEQMNSLNYRTTVIHLSQLLKVVPNFELNEKANSTLYEESVFGLMESGNEFRRKLGSDALVGLAISKIRATREKITGEAEKPANRHAYILRSLKHPAEVDTLREIYGPAFFLIAAYSPQETRIQNISEKIHSGRGVQASQQNKETAISLINKDDAETNNKFGQQVRQTFWKGDAYINVSEVKSSKENLKRVFDLWFGSPFITPTRDEFAMFCARAASYKSSAMARQVGASITDRDGSIIALGTNEIPKAGGGHYWSNDKDDSRDFTKGIDSSDELRKELLIDSLDRLIKCGWKAPNSKDIRELAAEVLEHEEMEGADLQALTEFQRVVHAEMGALMDAAKRGVPVNNLTLYSTTFPCHACARHIVASGIKRVVYIEPYAKSLVGRLYSDSISIDKNKTKGKVTFEPYIGIAPRRYLSLFKMGTRKDKSGKIVKWKKTESYPRLEGWKTALSIENENPKSVEFRQKLEDNGFVEESRPK